jgi:regulator of sigma E protease
VPSAEDGDGYTAFLRSLPQEPTLTFDVLRDGQTLSVEGPYLQPPLVTQVVPRSAAYEAGLRPGDVITHVDGTAVFAFGQLQDAVILTEDQPLSLKVWRAGESLDFSLTPKASDEPQEDGTFKRHMRIGIIGGMAFEPATQAPGLGEAFTGSVASTWRIVDSSITGLGEMIAGRLSTCNLSGPLGIAQTSGAMARQGLETFIYFIAVISTAVGLLNLFPIPALDGGHLVFYGYEAVRGKPPSNGAQRVLMTIGLAMVLSLMVFALGNDLFCP